MTDQANLEQWHVQVEAGDVRLWTLDQLDAAFKAELVDESTFVLEVGKTEWMQLGTLLGGGDEDDAPPPTQASASAAPLGAQMTSYTPIAPVMFHDGPSSAPYSTAPMASDIEDESPASFRRSGKRPLAMGLGVVLAAAGVAAFAFTHGHGFASAEEAPAVAAVAPPPAPPAPAPAADPQPATQESPADVQARLSKEQLLKLADADRALAAKQSAQRKARAAAAPHHSHGAHVKEKSPFHNGGAQGDPLNAKL